MGSGSKTELITIERVSRIADGGGGGSETWASIGQVWAEAKWIGGGEKRDRGAVREATKYRFTVLTDEAEALGIRASVRIEWRGDHYNIRERPRRLQRAADTEIFAESGVAS